MIRKTISGSRGIVFFLAVLLAAAPAEFTPTRGIYQALAHVSADSLRGNLSFLASDLLAGRSTPSPGLDIAAEYIAAQFRRAGLEPAGDDGYFQTARMINVRRNAEGLALVLHNGAREVRLAPEHAGAFALDAVDLQRIPLYKLDVKAAMPAAAALKGKAVVADFSRASEAVWRQVRALEPAVIVDTGSRDLPQELLVDNQELDRLRVPRIEVREGEPRKILQTARAGLLEWTVSGHLPPAIQTPVRLRNVAGVLRGSDPALRNTYILLTAHYDHIGVKPDGKGDRIYNGANDDGSGTVSVIEVAGALSALEPRPKRSIVFMTFFGEELGGLGSRYYARHPLFPLDATVADINLEQLGRTDASEGRQVNRATLTGFEFSDVSSAFRTAGSLTGIEVYDPRNGDEYFDRSDNVTFAERGIPAHTLVVAFMYPDYHAVGDEWQKIDYDNLARVNRMIALGTIILADRPEPPHWNSSNPRAAPYFEAFQARHSSHPPAGEPAGNHLQ